ncbi:MAG: zinc ribbon domain-containing protein [Anaerolineae bacterium]|nr:zinc ribbon domain-containing protein [Anaerolineae bacterium]
MPIYEYYCSDCAVRFNSLQKITDPAPACPRCGNTGVKKLISGAAVLHSDPEHEANYRAAQKQIDQGDTQEIARFFREHGGELAGRVDGQLTTSAAFHDLLERVEQGAAEADMTDLEDALVDATGSPYKTGYHTPEPDQARLMAQDASITGKMTEAERQQEAERRAGPGHQHKLAHPGDFGPEHEDAVDKGKPPKSPWSAPNIGWTS